ncbi:MAG: hypothetical protein PHD01_03170 [Geobacteraceae bacterium]|nr:hypothetical protein [Geobacteraceae bacterium]
MKHDALFVRWHLSQIPLQVDLDSWCLKVAGNKRRQGTAPVNGKPAESIRKGLFYRGYRILREQAELFRPDESKLEEGYFYFHTLGGIFY